MTQYGYSLMCELYHPSDLLEQAARAEEAGFDFLTIPTTSIPGLLTRPQPVAWSVLGALAAQTRDVELVSLMTCPTIRYHPVIVAQKAATVAAMSGGRFHLGLGGGENLNEHVVGRGWPPPRVRHEMLDEAIDIMRSLWAGGFHSHEGALQRRSRPRLRPSRPATPRSRRGQRCAVDCPRGPGRRG